MGLNFEVSLDLAIGLEVVACYEFAALFNIKLGDVMRHLKLI